MNKKHLAALKPGVAYWNQWRQVNPKVIPDLSGANLAEADLGGVDLREANLRGASLTGAILDWANLVRADLVRADLRGANLHKADLGWAILNGVILNEADLGWAKLNETNLEGANLEGANLEGANLEGANLMYTRLDGAILSGTCLDPMNKPNGDCGAFETEGEYIIGYRTRWSSIAQIALVDGQRYEAEVFSTADTECHPGWYLWPSVEAARAYSMIANGLVKVRTVPAAIHHARSKYRAQWIEVLGSVGEK